MNSNAKEQYEAYERECGVIRKENQVVLREFYDWMKARNKSERTAGMHFDNAAFYIQQFLLYEQPLRPHEGASSIGMYLGYWFIRKGAIATPGTVRTNATSLVQFYSFLVEKAKVPAKNLDQMRKTIKAEMKDWQERARRYNNPAIVDPGKIWI